MKGKYDDVVGVWAITIAWIFIHMPSHNRYNSLRVQRANGKKSQLFENGYLQQLK